MTAKNGRVGELARLALPDTVDAGELAELVTVTEAKEAADVDHQIVVLKLQKKYKLRTGARIDLITGAITRA